MTVSVPLVLEAYFLRLQVLVVLGLFVFNQVNPNLFTSLKLAQIRSFFIGQMNPTTARREHFELLDVSPGPNLTSSDNLATPGSPRVSVLTPSLVRTLRIKPKIISTLYNVWF